MGCFGHSPRRRIEPGLRCARTPNQARRAVYPFLCDYLRVWEMDQAKDAYEELRLFFRNFDPRHEREAEIFQKLGYIDTASISRRASKPRR